MWRWLWGADGQSTAASRRDRLAVLFAGLTFVCLSAAFFASNSRQFLMPGALSSAHSAIKNCASCHSKSGSGKLSWVHGLIAGDPLSDSRACLTCHKMADTAFNPHGASGEVLFQSTKRLTKVAATMSAPFSARAQNMVFPTHDIATRGLSCATCHQEHQGASFNLAKISNEQCRSCHVAKFDSFDGNHPEFAAYPVKRRTRIIYDHVAHFDKHFPEIAKKEPARRIPATCATCHNNREDKRIMAVAPFEKTCSGCHLNQITGKERASGPKGIAFLTVPGLDLQTLRKRNAAIGEWPEASEAELTPFMKIMIGRSNEGRALIRVLDGVNLQDLAHASDEQIKSVTALAWEIKRLFYALISGKASDVLGNLNLGSGAKLSPPLVADLTANIPRDVVIGAQREWLPNLAREIANGPIAGNVGKSTEDAEISQSKTIATDQKGTSKPDANHTVSNDEQNEGDSKPAKVVVKRDPPQNACLVRVLGQCLMPSGSQEAQADGDKSEPSNEKKSFGPAMQAGLRDVAPIAQLDGAKAPSNAPSKVKGTGQADDLLFPTEDELRDMKARSKGVPKGERPEASVPSASDSATPTLPSGSAPVISIQSNVDPESWAEYGGWYRQDYAIFYRPGGHKDKFVYSWLFLTGPQAPKGDKSAAADIFDVLANKDAQGACTKCHSIDDIRGRGRVVNFSPLSVADKQGHFTSFIHEPHFGVVGARGCLTCHEIRKDRAYLKSFEQGNPLSFASNFGAVKKEVCQTCHSANMVRQDCLTCHKYHVNGVITPIVNTKIPLQ